MAINLNYLNELFPNNPDAIKDLLQMFLTKTVADYQLLRSAISEKDLIAIHLLSHKLKSNVAVFGLLNLQEQYRKMELLAKSYPLSTLDEIESINNSIELEMDEAIKSAKYLIDS